MQYKLDMYVFFRKDYSNPRNETGHKFAPIGTGSYPIVRCTADTVVIQKVDGKELVSKERVVQALSPTLETTTGTLDRAIDVSNYVAARITDRPSQRFMDLPG